MLSKMLDYQRNIHADAFQRELARATPEFIAIFGLENLFHMEASRKAVLHILKCYVERRQSQNESALMIKNLLKSPETRQDLLEHINLSNRRKHDSNSNLSVGRQTMRMSHSNTRGESQVRDFNNVPSSASSVSSFLRNTKRSKNTIGSQLS